MKNTNTPYELENPVACEAALREAAAKGTASGTRITLNIPKDDESQIRRKLTGLIRVDPEAEIAVRKLAAATGLTQREVASQLLIQASVVCHIVKGGELTWES